MIQLNPLAKSRLYLCVVRMIPLSKSLLANLLDFLFFFNKLSMYIFHSAFTYITYKTCMYMGDTKHT